MPSAMDRPRYRHRLLPPLLRLPEQSINRLLHSEIQFIITITITITSASATTTRTTTRHYR